MNIHNPTQTALSEKHHELLADIESVATRADAARKAPQAHANAILEAAEAAHVRVLHEWRASRGGTQNNLFFDALSKRLRRIIGYYRSSAEKKPEVARESEWVYRITDYEEIDFRRLAPWFRASAVDDAIRMGISLGLRELPGLRIFQEHPDE